MQHFWKKFCNISKNERKNGTFFGTFYFLKDFLVSPINGRIVVLTRIPSISSGNAT